MGQCRPLGLGRPGDGDSGLGPRPLDKARTVEADPWVLPAEHIGHAELRDGCLYSRHASRPARRRTSDRSGRTARLVGSIGGCGGARRPADGAGDRCRGCGCRGSLLFRGCARCSGCGGRFLLCLDDGGLRYLLRQLTLHLVQGRLSSWRPRPRWPARVTWPALPSAAPALLPFAPAPLRSGAAILSAGARLRPASDSRRSCWCTGCAPDSEWPTWRSRT